MEPLSALALLHGGQVEASLKFALDQNMFKAARPQMWRSMRKFCANGSPSSLGVCILVGASAFFKWKL